MSYRKKFAIKHLRQDEIFSDTAIPVLAHYYGRMGKRIHTYLREMNDENLHSLRIALRRFRYVLELYCPSVKPNRFTEVYELTVDLQNILGERRDIDVMRDKLGEISAKTGNALPTEIVHELDTKRAQLDTLIPAKLEQFVANKQVHKLVAD
ncbi:MAG: CHAD domain-containing protein [Turneriella sp.]